MTKHYFKRCLAGIVFSMLTVIALSAPALENSDKFGIVDNINRKDGWIVIDDQAVRYGPELKVHSKNGNTSVGDRAIEVGSPVRYRREFENGRPYVRDITVIEKLPDDVSDDAGR